MQEYSSVNFFRKIHEQSILLVTIHGEMPFIGPSHESGVQVVTCMHAFNTNGSPFPMQRARRTTSTVQLNNTAHRKYAVSRTVLRLKPSPVIRVDVILVEMFQHYADIAV